MDDQPRVLFVCKGSLEDGLGHVIRTRTVLEAAAGRLSCHLAVLGDGVVDSPLAGMTQPWSLVRTEPELAELAAELAPVAVVLDVLELRDETFERLSAHRPLVSLSPVFSHLDRVDAAFNRTRYSANGEEARADRYYGMQYAIVRPECRRIDTAAFVDHLDDDVAAIAISMGGADAPNRTLRVLEALRSLPAPATFWVLLGAGYAHSYRALASCVEGDRRHEVILAKTNRSMWRILRNTSLAVLAGGVTTYEAVYAGLPSVNVLGRRDDEFLVREPVEAGAAFTAGTFEDERLPQLEATVQTLVEDRERLLHAHRAARGLIDGRGADRVVDRIRHLLDGKVATEAESWAVPRSH